MTKLALYPPNELGALLDVIAGFAPRFAAAVGAMLDDAEHAENLA